MKAWLPVVRSGSGAEVYAERLARLLEREGIEARIGWYPWWWEFAPGAWPVAAPGGYDLVHANSWSAFRVRGRIPRVVTVHHCVHGDDLRPYETRWQRAYHAALIRRFEARSLRQAAAAVAVSDYTRRQVLECFGPRALDVIPNWIEPDVYVPRPGPRRGGPFRLLFVGNWSRRKGADLLAGLMQRLGPRFELVFTTGRRGRAAPKRLPANMRWAGPVAGDAAMAALYQDCDLLVVPSRLEGFGYAALEAMACGKPVVAFGAGALPELVLDGITGRVVPQDAVDEMAAACEAVAADPAVARSFGEAGRQRVMEHYTPAIVGRRYKALYERVLA